MESAYYVDTGLLSPESAGIQIMSFFGSSTVATTSTSAAAAAVKPAAALPPFPTFLLPSLPLSFLRRKSRRQPSFSSAASSDAHLHSRNSGEVAAVEEDEDDYDDNDPGSPPSLSGSVDSASSSVRSSISDAGLPASLTSTIATTVGSTTGVSSKKALSSPRHPPRRLLGKPTPATLRCGICATDLAFASQIVSKGFTGRHGRAFLVAPPSDSNTPRLWSSSLRQQQQQPTTAAGELVNIKIGRPENRQLVTGSHVVADISCRVCGTKVGWKYVDARESAQRYKVGKFILETARVSVWRGWGEDRDSGRRHSRHSAGGVDGDDDCLYALDCDDDGDYHDDYDDNDDDDDDRGEKETPFFEAKWDGGSVKDDEDEGPIVFDSEDEDECEDLFAGTWNAEAVKKRRKARRAMIGRRV